MKQLKTIALLLLLGFVALSSCQKDDTNLPSELKYRDLPGKYQITAVQSAQLIDVKGDGISSTNLYRQMFEPKYIDEEKGTISYPITGPSNALTEIQPISNWGQSDIPFAVFWFPMPIIEEVADGTLGRKLGGYTSAFIHCLYEFDADDNVILKNINGDSRFPFNRLKELKRASANEFSLFLSLNLFDFSTNQWKLTDVVITYKKMEI
ncbi:MAG: hypothetical protein Q4G48_09290 [Bacteroidia bacterium]|nr:hypothetical protein [Bacteroidia bacterium]